VSLVSLGLPHTLLEVRTRQAGGTFSQAIPARSGRRPECGPFNFEVGATADVGSRPRRWQIWPNDAPLAWERDGFGREEAKARAERLKRSRISAILTAMRRFLAPLYFVLRPVVVWTASVVCSMVVLSAGTVLSYTVMRIIFGHW
jgi:hypothetical protein